MAKAKSKKQQMAAGAALSAKRGKTSKSRLRGASRQMVESMSESELAAMAGTRRKPLPRRNSTTAAKKRAAKTTAKTTARKPSRRSAR